MGILEALEREPISCRDLGSLILSDPALLSPRPEREVAPSARQVLAAGTPQQVAEAVEAAQPYKEQLAERGVLLIPLPIYAAEDGAPVPESMPLTAEDLRCCYCPTPAAAGACSLIDSFIDYRAITLETKGQIS